jgi:hypothetical protein
MGKWAEQRFFKGRSTNGQKKIIIEEMHNIPGNKGNANQNYVEVGAGGSRV